jgi:predicted metal-binding protein
VSASTRPASARRSSRVVRRHRRAGRLRRSNAFHPVVPSGARLHAGGVADPRASAAEEVQGRPAHAIVLHVCQGCGTTATVVDLSAAHHLFVCTSCRRPGEEREPRELRSGARLFRNLSERSAGWARREGFVILACDCLSVCPRPCGIALRAPGKFVYVFGDLVPGEAESAVIECATLYRRSSTGFLPREERPRVLRAGVLSRIPPLELP